MAKNQKNKSAFGVIIPSGIVPYPQRHEITAADILSKHLLTDVCFVPNNQHKTADFLIKGAFWELKSPTGNGKYTIQHSLQAALRQSANIIFDTRRSKMDYRKIRQALQSAFSRIRKIKRLILITKTGKAIELEK